MEVELVTEDILYVCRICLRSDEKDMIGVFELISEEMISKLIEICCGVQILDCDDLPARICSKCLNDLKIAYKLREQCQRSARTLKTGHRAVLADVEYEEVIENDIDHLIVEDEAEETVQEEIIEQDSEKEIVTKVVVIHQRVEDEQIQIQRASSSSRKSLSSSNPQCRHCEICDRTFARIDIYTAHVKRHNNEKNFICKFCEKGFVNSFEMKRHMRIHTGDKPYPCNFCTKSFSDFTSRNRHHNVHKQSRPYTCKVCGKGFNYANVLQRHLTVHSGEKKFRCSTCDKSFSQQHHLKKHLEIHKKRLPKKNVSTENAPEANWSTMEGEI